MCLQFLITLVHYLCLPCDLLPWWLRTTVCAESLYHSLLLTASPPSSFSFSCHLTVFPRTQGHLKHNVHMLWTVLEQTLPAMLIRRQLGYGFITGVYLHGCTCKHTQILPFKLLSQPQRYLLGAKGYEFVASTNKDMSDISYVSPLSHSWLVTVHRKKYHYYLMRQRFPVTWIN